MAKVNGAAVGAALCVIVTLVLTAVGLFILVQSSIPAESAAGATAPAPVVEKSVEGTNPDLPADQAAACDFDEWIGKKVDEAEALAKETGRPYRILPPNSAATMDYSAQRINIETDENGVVLNVRCG